MPGLVMGLKAVFADAIDAHFHVFDQSGECPLHGLHIQIEAVRSQAFEMAAALAIKVGMRGMVGIGSQAINKCTTATVEAVRQTVFHHQIQNSVNRHAIDIGVSSEYFKYLLSTQRAVAVSDDFKNLKPF